MSPMILVGLLTASVCGAGVREHHDARPAGTGFVRVVWRAPCSGCYHSGPTLTVGTIPAGVTVTNTSTNGKSGTCAGESPNCSTEGPCSFFVSGRVRNDATSGVRVAWDPGSVGPPYPTSWDPGDSSNFSGTAYADCGGTTTLKLGTVGAGGVFVAFMTWTGTCLACT